VCSDEELRDRTLNPASFVRRCETAVTL